eukprot:NODE_2528_length_519_cov_159.406383_g2007_i0.p2 GENE.NODE_2528_length_519_cov_159.406383_g2007_i0~~NODE_2528_length_519_cov_159.406383_g2007_i0.p2  ORF type:complete len:145 (-),score=25.25 NODE_2528_length_519_cov_159.406383_g2007_i0:84-461(-)
MSDVQEMLLFLLTLFVFGSAEISQFKSICIPNTNCSSCLAQTDDAGVNACSWCYKDGNCHDVGSVFNICNNIQCASVSQVSKCENRNCKACLYPTCNHVNCDGVVVPIDMKCLCMDNGGRPCPSN